MPVNRAYGIQLHIVPTSKETAWVMLTMTVLKIETGTPIRLSDARPNRLLRNNIDTKDSHVKRKHPELGLFDE